MDWLDRTLISCDCFYLLCLSEKDFRKALKHLELPKREWPRYLANDRAGATTHFFDTRWGDVAIVTFGDRYGYGIHQIHALLVHEAVHIWQAQRDAMSEDSPSSEFEAYAIQTISQNLIESYQKQNKKKSGGRRERHSGKTKRIAAQH